MCIKLVIKKVMADFVKTFSTSLIIWLVLRNSHLLERDTMSFSLPKQ